MQYKITETQLMNQIIRALQMQGYYVFRANVGKVKTEDGRYFRTGLPKGFPDLFGFKRDGKAFTIEVKTSTGRLSAHQSYFKESVLERCNIIHGVARSVNEAIKIVDEELKGFGY